MIGWVVIGRLPRLRLGVVVSVALASAGGLAACGVAENHPKPAPTSGSSTADCRRPYAPSSPWNRPVGPRPRVHPLSARYIHAIADNREPLTSDPDQFTPAVYEFDERTPLRTMKLSGYYSTYEGGDNARKGHGFAPTISGIPIPDNAVAPSGDDGQVVLWNPTTGVEYAFWQFNRTISGTVSATNGYRYYTRPGFQGRFADGMAGRGAGLPYLGGLVRPCEIERGRIDHALAFAYSSPSPRTFVYPASKLDGLGSRRDLPEGSRLQLNPRLDEADFKRWRLPTAARTIARALQTYGMYLVDNSGSSKVFLEARQTARWDASIRRDLVSRIPWSAFRVLRPPPG
jgi:hypothetical protein